MDKRKRREQPKERQHGSKLEKRVNPEDGWMNEWSRWALILTTFGASLSSDINRVVYCERGRGEPATPGGGAAISKARNERVLLLTEKRKQKKRGTLDCFDRTHSMSAIKQIS